MQALCPTHHRHWPKWSSKSLYGAGGYSCIQERKQERECKQGNRDKMKEKERERENHPQKTRLNLNTVSQVQSMAEKELTPLVTYTMTIFTVFYKVFKNLVPKPWDFPSGLFSKASAFNAGDPGLIPASGTSSEEGNGNPLQYSCLENPMDGGTW